VTPTPAKRVLVVDDSATMRAILSRMVERAGFVVAGTADCVAEAERMVRSKAPDLVLSDIHMADGNGIELTRRVLSERGVPIILITAHDPANPELVFRAIEAGALELLAKPPAVTSPELEAYRRTFEMTLRTLAGIPVVRRRHVSTSPNLGGSEPPVREGTAARLHVSPYEVKTMSPIIAIAASTGGPVLVGDLLRALPHDAFAFATVVQHIVPDFADNFRVWLGEYSGKNVLAAQEGGRPSPGCVYAAPPNCHLELRPNGTFRITSASALRMPHVPSADVLFRSLALARPLDCLAILLTGMGSDGAAGLLDLKSAGALTIVQRPDTAAVDGMPRSAIALGAATHQIDPKGLITMLSALPPLRTTPT
ncbi:MAG TPA: chemotaxis protein CheB, partial [Polyangiaceae bacterium]